MLGPILKKKVKNFRGPSPAYKDVRPVSVPMAEGRVPYSPNI